MSTVQTESIEQAFIAPFRQLLPETGRERREAAVAALPAQQVPTRKWEDWKYTNLKPLVTRGYVAAPAATVSELDPYLIPGLEADRLVFVNGRYEASLSSLSLNRKVLQVVPLSTLSGGLAEVFEAHFGQAVSGETGLFPALNTAYASEGTLLYVPDGQVAKAPIHLIQLTVPGSEAVATQARNLFVMGRHAQAQVIETSRTLGEGSSLRNVVTEIFVGEEAQLTYVKMQQESDHASVIDHTEVHQQGNSRFDIYTLSLSGDVVRNNLLIHLMGQHTETHLMGATLISGDQHVDHFTQIHHREPNCFSNELYKSIIDERATASFYGKIHVYQDAQKTNAFQSNRNILLSDAANIFTKPQLEIYADDVKCSHGATTGRLDRDALFYLMARGIPEKQARLILVHAFVMEVVEELAIEPLKEYIGELVDRRF
ncbi:MAG: Fe-S cluster assembly protein SufD [Bacteroidetes bacterium]|nr:MAG: Fe-S cluster assembly protein SufD [Bacteroidota bacterium]